MSNPNDPTDESTDVPTDDTETPETPDAAPEEAEEPAEELETGTEDVDSDESDPADADQDDQDDAEDDEASPAPAARPELATGMISPFAFLAQVWAELSKTVWPTRSELSTAVIITLAFTALSVVALVSIDSGLGELSRAVFG